MFETNWRSLNFETFINAEMLNTESMNHENIQPHKSFIYNTRERGWKTLAIL